MSNQLRFNEGKPHFHYWYSTRLASFLGEDLGELAPRHAKAASALLENLTLWLCDRIDHRALIEFWREVCYDLDLASLYTEVCEFGETKYDRGNFRKGQSVCHYADSCIRHLKRLIKDEACDQDSGKSHFGHAWWNVGQIFEIMEQPEVAKQRDDRLFHHGDLSGR